MRVARDGVGGSRMRLMGRGLWVGKIIHAKARRRKEDGSRRDAEGAELTYDRIIGSGDSCHRSRKELVLGRVSASFCRAVSDRTLSCCEL